MPPPDTVLRAFGLPAGEAHVLPGGQGTSHRAAGAVLKPASGGGRDEWTADLLDDLAALGSPDFRVPVSRRSTTGAVVVDGWVCADLLPGEHRLHGADWPAAITVARAFSAALAQLDRPLPARQPSCWSRADAVSWGEAAPPSWSGPAAPLLHRLTVLAHPVDAPDQLVHGDLAGNLLWADDVPPAVIDLTPYRRPAGWATAVVAVDAVLWFGADAEELHDELEDAERGQLLLRALSFRLISSELLHRQPAGAPGPRPTEADLRQEVHAAADLLTAVERDLAC